MPLMFMELTLGSLSSIVTAWPWAAAGLEQVENTSLHTCRSLTTPSTGGLIESTFCGAICANAYIDWLTLLYFSCRYRPFSPNSSRSVGLNWMAKLPAVRWRCCMNHAALTSLGDFALLPAAPGALT